MNVSQLQTSLTQNELAALLVLVKSCMQEMGGKRPIALASDMYTFVDIWCLVDNTDGNLRWAKPQAKGVFSSLSKKGLLDLEDGALNVDEDWFVELDTVWDDLLITVGL